MNVDYAAAFFYYWDLLAGADVPRPVPEYRFQADRRWRADAAWPEARLLVEIEGGIWTNGRHTRGSGFVNDIKKYNAAAVLGYRLLRYTYDMLCDDPQGVIDEVKLCLKQKQNS